MHFGEATAARVVVQYGGSVKPENATDLLACPDIDGSCRRREPQGGRLPGIIKDALAVTVKGKGRSSVPSPTRPLSSRSPLPRS